MQPSVEDYLHLINGDYHEVSNSNLLSNYSDKPHRVFYDLVMRVAYLESLCEDFSANVRYNQSGNSTLHRWSSYVKNFPIGGFTEPEFIKQSDMFNKQLER